MNGSINVESQYERTEGVGPENSGTKFIVTMPVLSSNTRQDTASDEERSKVAILSYNGRSLDGLKIAWESFGFDVSSANSVSELGEIQWKYVWAELNFLINHPSEWSQLARREDLLILIPYDTKDTLDVLPGLLKAQNVVLLPKPLLWHTFARRVITTRERRRSAASSQALRFAPKVEVLDGSSSTTTRPLGEPGSSNKQQYTVLIVEDNPINRKLGVKMLQALSYKTLFATDGVDALSMMTAHNAEIDCVLMDQSMPKMDGVTSTRMIRKMEEEGKLKKGRPIIAVTAVVNAEAKEEFREAGADDFLAKPLSLERLRDVLGIYLPTD
jgi:CheY-like chemotaxis protein